MYRNASWPQPHRRIVVRVKGNTENANPFDHRRLDLDLCQRRHLPRHVWSWVSGDDPAHRGCGVSVGFGDPDGGQCPPHTTTAPMDAFEQQPYNGTSTKLCLAFDIGTSFSSISYCVLNPGQIPTIRNVNRCGCAPQR